MSKADRPEGRSLLRVHDGLYVTSDNRFTMTRLTPAHQTNRTHWVLIDKTTGKTYDCDTRDDCLDWVDDIAKGHPPKARQHEKPHDDD